MVRFCLNFLLISKVFSFSQMTKAAIDKLQPAAEDSDSDLEVIYTVCTFMPVCSNKIRTATLLMN